MSAPFALGTVVVNFNQPARVVGLFRSADGAPCDMDGWPILRAVKFNGRLHGGKWVADPAKCRIVGDDEQPAFFNSLAPTRCHFGECGAARCTGCGVTVQS